MLLRALMDTARLTAVISGLLLLTAVLPLLLPESSCSQGETVGSIAVQLYAGPEEDGFATSWLTSGA